MNHKYVKTPFSTSLRTTLKMIADASETEKGFAIWLCGLLGSIISVSLLITTLLYLFLLLCFFFGKICWYICRYMCVYLYMSIKTQDLYIS